MVTPRRRSRRVQKAEEIKRNTALKSPMKSPVKKVTGKRKMKKKPEVESKSLPRIRLKSMVGRKRKIREDDPVENVNPKRPKRKSSNSRKRSLKKVEEEEVLPEGHFEIMEFGPLYLSWISYQDGDKKVISALESPNSCRIHVSYCMTHTVLEHSLKTLD